MGGEGKMVYDCCGGGGLIAGSRTIFGEWFGQSEWCGVLFWGLERGLTFARAVFWLGVGCGVRWGGRGWRRYI